METLTEAAMSEIVKVVKRCRKCGRTFSQPASVSPPNYNGGFYDHSYCQKCRDLIRDRSRMCAPRYTGVSGHAMMEVGRA